MDAAIISAVKAMRRTPKSAGDARGTNTRSTIHSRVAIEAPRAGRLSPLRDARFITRPSAVYSCIASRGLARLPHPSPPRSAAGSRSRLAPVGDPGSVAVGAAGAVSAGAVSAGAVSAGAVSAPACGGCGRRLQAPSARVRTCTRGRSDAAQIRSVQKTTGEMNCSKRRLDGSTARSCQRPVVVLREQRRVPDRDHGDALARAALERERRQVRAQKMPAGWMPDDRKRFVVPSV